MCPNKVMIISFLHCADNKYKKLSKLVEAVMLGLYSGLVQISAEAPDILRFSMIFLCSSRTAPQLGHDHFLPFHYSPTILSLNATYSKMLTAVK
jgi:hypothetical protein